MTDFNAMSNDELLREYQKQSTYSGMSNEELKAVYARQAGKPQEDRTWYEDLAKKSLASIEKGIVAVPEKAGTFLGKVSAPFLPLSQNLDAEIAKSVPSYVPPSEAVNILKSNIAPAVRQYYEKQGAYKPENQFTSWPGQLLGSVLEFTPEMLTTFPMTGAGKVSSLVEKGLEKAGTRLMPNVNNAALGLLGRTAARGAGGAAGAVPYTLATEDKPSSAMLDNMLGFGAASAGFGLAGDLVKGLTKGIASRIRTKAPITEDMLNETFVKPEQKQITFENKNRPGETFTMPENLPEGFVKGMSPEEMAAIQRTKGTDIEKLLAKLPESLDYNKMSDVELKAEYVKQFEAGRAEGQVRLPEMKTVTDDQMELKPAIPPEGKINAITREQAGGLMAKGDPSVVEHIKTGLEGGIDPKQMQDAIRNQMVDEIANAPKGAERQQVRDNVKSIGPVINEALSSKSAKPSVIQDSLISKPAEAPKGEISNPDLQKYFPVIKESIEPWKMTREEWYNTKDSFRGTGAYSTMRGEVQPRIRAENIERLNYNLKPKWDEELKKYEQVTHEDVIQQALSEGKPVPSSVLADYPDLAAGALEASQVKKAKEPWEMTKEVYLKSAFTEGIDRDVAKVLKEKGGKINQQTFNTLEIIATVNHKNIVKQALSKEKPVSLEVLKDYPDLQAQRGQLPIEEKKVEIKEPIENNITQSFAPELNVSPKEAWQRENPSTHKSPEVNAIRIGKTQDTKSWADIKNISPVEPVTIYRATEHGDKIEAGDFVSPDRETVKFYARDILGQRGKQQVKISSIKVKASEIKLHPDHQAIGVENEFIYNPGLKPEPVKTEIGKWLAEINTNVNNLDYNVNEVYALRGDNFIPKKTFRKSFNRPDTKKTTRMDGISGVELAINAAGGDNSISMNHLLKQIEKAGKYGKNIFLLKGEKIGLGNDEWNNEIMLGKHKIIGKITKSDLTKAFEEAKKQGNLDVLYTLGGKNPYNDLPRDSKARVKTVFDYITAKGITATDDQIKKLLDPRETAVFKSLTASPSPESFGSRQRSFLETAAKSPIITEPLQKKVKDISPQDYIVQPMPSQFVKADLRIADGIDRAIEYVKDTKTVTTEIPEKSATFQRIIDYFQNNGRMDRAAEFIDLYDQSLREWGRGIQLASRHSMAAIDKASPEAFVKWAEKQITTAKAERGWLDKKLGKEIPDLTNEDKAALLQMINDANKIPDYIERNVEKLKAVELVAKRIPPGISSMIDSYRYQNMLSGWITTERNTGSNIINTYLTRPYDLAIRGGIDWGKSIVTGKERQHYLSDVPDYYKVAFNSFGNAVEAFRLAMSGKTPIGKPELGVEAKTAIEQARAAQMPKALTVIPRFMEAQDKFFMTIIGDAEYALNIKKGMGQDIAYTKAVDTAQELLYRTSLKSQHAGLSMPSQALKGLGVLLLKGRNTPGLRTISKWGVPFVTTPVNVGIQMIERSPLAILRTNIGEAAVTKMTGGIIVSAAGAMAAMNGNTTWSAPTNEDEKKWFYATGRKPYSVRIGDNWVSMWYAGPFALALALPAAYKHYTADAKESVSWGTLEKTGRMAVGVGRLIGSQTSAQSVGNLFSWMAGDDVKAPGQIAFTASQLIPLSGTMRNISTLVDPVYRKPETFAENMKQGIPFMSRSLAANRTPEGTEAVRETKNALIPYNISSSTEYEKMYPAYKEMRQMEYIGRKIDSIGKKLMAGEITQETADSQLDILMKNVLKPTNEGGLI